MIVVIDLPSLQILAGDSGFSLLYFNLWISRKNLWLFLFATCKFHLSRSAQHTMYLKNYSTWWGHWIGRNTLLDDVFEEPPHCMTSVRFSCGVVQSAYGSFLRMRKGNSTRNGWYPVVQWKTEPYRILFSFLEMGLW